VRSLIPAVPAVMARSFPKLPQGRPHHHCSSHGHRVLLPQRHEAAAQPLHRYTATRSKSCQFAGTTAVGPYWASQKAHCPRTSPVRTSFESPWQNGVAERWVGSCRRDLLDHIIAVDERHLKRLLSEYIRYYHEDRTHLGLGKGTPEGRTCTIASGHVLSYVRLGGLHHRYDRAA